jgi:hypothetical protein
MWFVDEPAYLFTLLLKLTLYFCHALVEFDFFHSIFGNFQDFYVVEAEIVFEVVQFSRPEHLVKSPLARLLPVLQYKVVARFAVVLLKHRVLNPLHLCRIGVHAHLFRLVIEKINVHRVAPNQDGENSHALRQKHIFHIVIIN